MPVEVNPPLPPPDPTSLESGKYNTPIILNRIFDLVLSMITSLQKAAASQANRLSFMSRWQKSYTDVMTQIHTFQANDGSFAQTTGSSDEAKKDTADRGALNQFNSSLIQGLQNRQSLISDDAKALQSNVNQTNDAVNQQSNLGTAILQELNTLLASIFR